MDQTAATENWKDSTTAAWASIAVVPGLPAHPRHVLCKGKGMDIANEAALQDALGKQHSSQERSTEGGPEHTMSRKGAWTGGFSGLQHQYSLTYRYGGRTSRHTEDDRPDPRSRGQSAALVKKRTEEDQTRVSDTQPPKGEVDGEHWETGEESPSNKRRQETNPEYRIRCFFCHLNGHYAHQCITRAWERGEGKYRANTQDRTVTREEWERISYEASMPSRSRSRQGGATSPGARKEAGN